MEEAWAKRKWAGHQRKGTQLIIFYFMSELEDNVYTLSFLSYLKERNYFFLIFFS